MIERRQMLAGVLGLGALSATGCSTVQDLSLRQRIKRGLDGDSLLGEALGKPSTEIDRVELAALPEWQIVDVRYNGLSHPQRWYLAVTRSGKSSVVVLSGFPQRWDQIITGASVDSPATAASVARTWFDTTRSMATLGYRIESVDDIQWPSKPGPDVARARKRLARTYAIGAPEAERVTDGWQMTLWSMEDQTLREHTITVSGRARVVNQVKVREEGLPAAIGI